MLPLPQPKAGPVAQPSSRPVPVPMARIASLLIAPRNPSAQCIEPRCLNAWSAIRGVFGHRALQRAQTNSQMVSSSSVDSRTGSISVNVASLQRAYGRWIWQPPCYQPKTVHTRVRDGGFLFCSAAGVDCISLSVVVTASQVRITSLLFVRPTDGCDYYLRT